MKRMMISVLALILILSGISQPCIVASATESDVERIYLEDGSYYEITVTTSHNSRTADTCYGQKRQRYYTKQNELQWTVALSVEYTYIPGVSATCVDATCDVYISDDVWKCTTSSATYSGANASCYAEMVRSFLLIPVETVPVNLTAYCDTYGNLS